MRLLGADPEAAGDTDKAYPATKGARALAKAIEKIGRREQGGRNQGPIVEWSTRWLFEARNDLDTYEDWYRAGKLAWCAGFAGRCYLEAGAHVPPYWAVDCDSLLIRLISRARRAEWTVRRWPCPVEPGDVVFFGHGPKELPTIEGLTDLKHVELVERFDAASGALYSVGGNTTRTTDRVARCERLAAAAQIYAVAHAL